jgi:transcriptional regulator with XRE-family HTH domain
MSYLSQIGFDRVRTMQAFNQLAFWHMEFPERLTTLRKERGLTQQALADQVGVHVLQIRRYEGGNAQPTLDVIKRLAQALRVSADAIVFDASERGPDEDFLFQFEAVSRMPKKERDAIRTLLEAMIVKNQVAGVLEGVAKAGADKPASKTTSKRTAHAAQR